MEADKRRHSRTPLRDCMAIFSSPGKPFQLGGRIQDISEGGLSLVCGTEVDWPNKRMELEVLGSGTRWMRIESIQCRLVYEEALESGEVRRGIQFVSIPEIEKESLKYFMQSHRA